MTDTLAATPYMVSVGMAITPPLSNTSQAAGKHSVMLSSLYSRKYKYNKKAYRVDSLTWLDRSFPFGGNRRKKVVWPCETTGSNGVLVDMKSFRTAQILIIR